MEPRRTAFAKVQVVLEIATGTWGPDCTMGQVVAQAKDEALRRVDRMLVDAGTSGAGVRISSIGTVDVRIVESPA